MRQEMIGFWDAVASAGLYANNLHFALAPHTNTSSLNFYRPDALPDAQPTVSKHKNTCINFLPLRIKINKKSARKEIYVQYSTSYVS